MGMLFGINQEFGGTRLPQGKRNPLLAQMLLPHGQSCSFPKC